MQAEELVELALLLPPDERGIWLQRECEGNDDLLTQVQQLIAERLKAISPSVTQSASDAITAQGLHASSMTEPFEFVKEGRTIGPYTLENRLGEGGMGSVWVARQHKPIKMRVALKLIKPGLDSKGVIQRFEQERQALAMMDHPNIARVINAGLTDEGLPYFAMELVNGAPIIDFCDQAKLSTRDRLDVFLQVCAAVQHAHQKGIIHRDLKPANILVTLIDGRPTPKIIDFGVAKALSSSLIDNTSETQFGSIVGTLEYMAPEQAGFSGSDADTRADIYALGVILYELLSGLKPIDSNRLRQAGLQEMIRMIKEEEPVKPSTRLSTNASTPSIAAVRQTDPKRLSNLLRGDLDWIILKCLEKDRSRRYETANQLALEIRRHLEDEPILAGPPSKLYVLRKFVRKHRLKVVSALGVVTALVIGLVASLILLDRAVQSEALANQLKIDEQNQRIRAETNTEKANRSARQARQALDNLTDNVVERMLFRQAALSDQDKQFLKRTLELYQDLTLDDADSREAMLLKARGFEKIAYLQIRLGLPKDAENTLAQIVTMYEGLAAKQPDVFEHRLDQAESLYRQALQMEQLNRNDDAMRLSVRSEESLQEAIKRFPDQIDLRRTLASVLSRKGHLNYKENKLEQADACYKSALKEIERLVNLFPSNPQCREVLGRVLGNYSILQRKMGRRDESLVTSARALAILNELLKERPNHDMLEALQATYRMNRATLLGEANQFAEAIKLTRQSVEVFQRWLANRPGEAEIREQLAFCLQNLCNYEHRSGHNDASLSAMRQCLEHRMRLMRDFPEVPHYAPQFAKCASEFGFMLTDANLRQEAELVFEQAVPVWRTLNVGSPVNLKYLEELGHTITAIGNLAGGRGDWDRAQQQFAQAIKTRSQLANLAPLDKTYRSHVASSYHDHAMALVECKQIKLALEDQLKVAEHMERVHQLDSNTPSAVISLANYHEWLAHRLNERQFLEAGLAQYRAGLQVRNRLNQLFPNRADLQILLIWSHRNIGITLDTLGKRQEAIDDYAAALAIEVKQTSEELRSLREELASKIDHASDYLLKSGQAALSLDGFQKALVAREGTQELFPDDPMLAAVVSWSHWNIAQAEIELGRIDEALSQLQKLVTIPPRVRSIWAKVEYPRFVGCELLVRTCELAERLGRLEDARSFAKVCVEEHRLWARDFPDPQRQLLYAKAVFISARIEHSSKQIDLAKNQLQEASRVANSVALDNSVKVVSDTHANLALELAQRWKSIGDDPGLIDFAQQYGTAIAKDDGFKTRPVPEVFKLAAESARKLKKLDLACDFIQSEIKSLRAVSRTQVEIAVVNCRLGLCLADQLKWPEAIALLTENANKLIVHNARLSASDREILQQSFNALVRAYEATNQPAEAAKWKRPIPPAVPSVNSGNTGVNPARKKK